MVGISTTKVPRRVGVRPIRVLKRSGARMTKVTTSVAIRMARVLKKLDRVIKRKRKEREQRAASRSDSNPKSRLLASWSRGDPKLDEEAEELSIVDEMLRVPGLESPSSPLRTHRSSVPSHSHSDTNPKPILVPYSPRPSGDPKLVEDDELGLVAGMFKSPSPTHVHAESPPSSPPRSNRSSVLFGIPRQLSPPLTRSTAPVQERTTAPPERATSSTSKTSKLKSPAEIQAIRRRYYLLQMRRYRSRPVVPIDPDADVEDVHLGFNPPSLEDEKYLDVTTRLTLFNIMMKLERKDGLDVLGDAFVLRNYQGVYQDEGKEKAAGGERDASGKVEEEREEEEPEILHLWNVFVGIVTNFSYRLITRQ
ncbi:hypothetical protein MVEN_01331600 [Mycena venus]|uniref:Uncharacterized protein n=1 Tax=Mycena venus TaxID=2733690 RepID=A0A8H7CW69_9AGAR|nr:hypothetical protein MVEN_01331600 [Mycena venus]